MKFNTDETTEEKSSFCKEDIDAFEECLIRRFHYELSVNFNQPLQLGQYCRYTKFVWNECDPKDRDKRTQYCLRFYRMDLDERYSRSRSVSSSSSNPR